MAASSLPALLAVLTGLLSCTVLGKVTSMNQHRQIIIHPNFYAETNICQSLTKPQREICYQQPDTTTVALQGLTEAVKECQHQFRNHRWNCSSLSTKTKNPFISAIFQKGFRETAFAHAISSAGVVVSVAKACSQGSLMNCGCDNHKYKKKEGRSHTWKWDGCSHNLRYGIKFAKLFLDSRENGEDFHSAINLHNNNVGRMAVTTNMQIKCKCHGLSGSCELKTCWRAVPDFRIIGKTLKEKFDKAYPAVQSNLANKKFMITNSINQKNRLKRKKLTPKKHKRDLLFYEKSPNFCDNDQSLDILGTSGRFCNRTHNDQGSCSALCCGRGYNLVKRIRTQTCNCKFHWCCTVECQNCTIEEWISICK